MLNHFIWCQIVMIRLNETIIIIEKPIVYSNALKSIVTISKNRQ